MLLNKDLQHKPLYTPENSYKQNIWIALIPLSEMYKILWFGKQFLAYIMAITSETKYEFWIHDWLIHLWCTNPAEILCIFSDQQIWKSAKF